MRRFHRTESGAGLGAVCLGAAILTAALLGGCAGPSTRILPRAQGNGADGPSQEGTPVLEAVNPFYLQESLEILSKAPRVSGSSDEEEAVRYLERLLGDYGYTVERQPFRYDQEDGQVSGINVEAARKAPSDDADILMIGVYHDTAAGSPGAGDNASGVAVFLETARLLAKLPTDTELRFVSFSGHEEGLLGARSYVSQLTKREKERIIGLIQLEPVGHVSDPPVVLGSMDGGPVLAGDKLKEAAFQLLGEDWEYAERPGGEISAFVQAEIPAVSVGQAWDGWEQGTPLDLVETVDVEEAAQVVDVVCRTAAEAMGEDSPSMKAKSHSYHDLDYSYVQKKDTPSWFGMTIDQIQAQTGRTGALVGEHTSNDGQPVEKYQFRMKWFGVDQLILSNYYFTGGKLDMISLEAAEAGIGFEEMKGRIEAVYGQAADSNDGPNGTEYDWADPVRGKFFALIPEHDGYALEIREYSTDRVQLEQRTLSGALIGASSGDGRCGTLMELVKDLIPGEMAGQISAVTFYTDGLGKTRTELLPGGQISGTEHAGGEGQEGAASEAGAQVWELAIDVEDALTEDGSWRDQTRTVKDLLGLYGAIVGSQDPAALRTAYDARFGTEEGRGAAGAGEAETGGDSAAAAEAGRGTVSGAETGAGDAGTGDTGAGAPGAGTPEAGTAGAGAPGVQNVGEQIGLAPGAAAAAYAEHPDYITAFQLFVLTEEPDQEPGEWKEEVRFFYGSEQLRAYRSWVRQNNIMQMEVSYAGED